MLASLNEGDVYGNLTPKGWINLTNDEITAAWLKGTGNFNVNWQGVRAVLWALQMKTLEQQRSKQND